MRVSVFQWVFAGLWMLTAAASPLSAGLITGTGNPIDALPGGTVIDFQSQTAGQYSSLLIDGVTFGGQGGTNGGWLTITPQSAGSFNTTGQYLTNEKHGYQTFTFGFASPVSGFGFNWGGAFNTWTLAAYDSAGDLIESHSLTPVNLGNTGQYYGISASGIARATLASPVAVQRDWVFIDDFTYTTASASPGQTTPAPEPASIVLLGVGLAGLTGIGMRRRARRQPVRNS